MSQINQRKKYPLNHNICIAEVFYQSEKEKKGRKQK